MSAVGAIDASYVRPDTRRRSPLYLSCLIFLGLVVLVAIVAPYVTPYDPNTVDLLAINAPPGTAGHLLGTDQNGRDLLSRLMLGSRTALLGPLIVTVVASALGIVAGAVAGSAGGWVDAVLSRIIDFLFAFPGLLLAVFAVALFGPGLLAPALALSIAYTPLGARLVRTLVIRESSKDYVRATRILGFSGTVTFGRHVLPNIAPVILSQSLLGFAYAVVDLAAISYLGLGIQPPSADWGLMISEGQSSVISGAIWPVFWPALMIVLVVACVNYVGEHIVDRFERG